MINQVYRLVSPRQFEIAYTDYAINDSACVVVRPTHLSICAADQRYYTGKRGKEALAKKLPMALIHEGVGEVVFDPRGEIATGTKVVMVPNTPVETDDVIAENYLRTSKFRSSGYDGFMQDYIFLRRDRFIALPANLNPPVAAFTELVTVAMHAISRFERKSHTRRQVFGVWGDGNLGYITALLLKKKFKACKVYVFGKTAFKLENFSFADATYHINEIPERLAVDHAFECVGGAGSQDAVGQIIDIINPEGSIALLGVSEYPIEVNTRMVLEKGLTLIGSSRSGYQDFKTTVGFLSENPDVIEYLETLVGSVNAVRSIADLIHTFEKDLTSPWGKTILEWQI
ncbi:ribitol-5-phosphate dehydrogenase [Weizmannia acidilactici]|jgi:ribitol-5-phosphate 2-dehydrogenase|uniref:Ribulose-5-phosphate reductase n=2 Tax=Heyndrickxia TaxID=2837504 RepID=A0A5J4JL38_9BACI|nr:MULTISPECIES: ribitol-5-phosphate dehydrogenase [Heyndrickxia]MDL5042039.1 ribitol-5-phosphate dehydrogenase [Heyndrickxia coagulans]GER67124.1 ribitol-5-phosphate dehydrogenase [Weizmannia acidilactici]GER71405.1 ribitol-5-phosphate dehydrogenase [Weizmannia acidilactici]GER74759.1 ribitol-5-phosphate dehydrogenase [Weizmannia acidilactici]